MGAQVIWSCAHARGRYLLIDGHVINVMQQVDATAPKHNYGPDNTSRLIRLL